MATNSIFHNIVISNHKDARAFVKALEKSSKQKENFMKHHITKYRENGKRYAESWLQINAFGNCYCFWRKKIEI